MYANYIDYNNFYNTKFDTINSSNPFARSLLKGSCQNTHLFNFKTDYKNCLYHHEERL